MAVVLVMFQFPHQWRPIKPSTRYLHSVDACLAYTTLAFSHSSRRPTFNLGNPGRQQKRGPIRIHELKVSGITIKRWLKADKKLQSHVQMNWLIIRCLECCCCSVKSSRPTKDDSIRGTRWWTHPANGPSPSLIISRRLEWPIWKVRIYHWGSFLNERL